MNIRLLIHCDDISTKDIAFLLADLSATIEKEGIDSEIFENGISLHNGEDPVGRFQVLPDNYN